MVARQQALTDIVTLREALRGLETKWDGKNSISRMKSIGSTHWRQMEWIGFYGEVVVRERLAQTSLINRVGDKFGNVTFDLKGTINWDIKTHPNSAPAAILNDCEATLLSIEKYGYHGLLIICVDCLYDETEDFKVWHDALKGGQSSYEKSRVERGAPSRRRKVAAKVTDISYIFLNSGNVHQLAKKQEGWRNSNGAPRRPKFSITHQQVIAMAEK